MKKNCVETRLEKNTLALRWIVKIACANDGCQVLVNKNPSMVSYRQERSAGKKVV